MLLRIYNNAYVRNERNEGENKISSWNNRNESELKIETLERERKRKRSPSRINDPELRDFACFDELWFIIDVDRHL